MTDRDLIQRVWAFVVSDPRFTSLGLRGGVREIWRELTGLVPDNDIVERIVRAFWLAWDEHFAKPCGGTIGRGSPFYQREGELSPWQENAIRALEDCQDV
jgi:hypothetical protein